jgi:hypothetical protein
MSLRGCGLANRYFREQDQYSDLINLFKKTSESAANTPLCKTTHLRPQQVAAWRAQALQAVAMARCPDAAQGQRLGIRGHVRRRRRHF